MTKIIDINRHGIRREIDHQWKPKKKARKISTGNKKLSTDTRKDIDISIVSEPDVRP